MKKLFVCVLAALMLMSFAACGTKAPQEVDVNALAKALTEGVAFDGEMTEEAQEILRFTFDVPDSAKICGYMPGGSSTECVVCVQCATGDDAAKVMSAVESYLAGLADNAGKYDPAEAQRLAGGTYTSRTDNLVVLVVATDVSGVSAIVEGFTK